MTHSQGGYGDDDGRRDDDSTRIVFRNEPGVDDDATKILTGAPGWGGAKDAAGTVIGVANIQQGVRVAGQAVDARGAQGSAGARDETVFITGQASVPAAQRFDPIVGWLVVRKGPGRGEARPVYYGQNSIGRGPDQRISLDFGDQRISREAHAYVIYDDALRKYFVRDNGKSNLVRLNGATVMMPTELPDRSELVIGDTTLIFVALCGAEFDWLAET